jgi:hypothetical protein
MIVVLPWADVEETANAYRIWIAFDSDHAPSGADKENIRAVGKAARKMSKTLAALNPRARHKLAVHIGAMLSAHHGETAMLEAAKLIDAIADASPLAEKEIPKNWRNTAERMAASSLRTIFEHYGIDFAATADYGNTSAAVATLQAIVYLGCNKKMGPESARKWIAEAKAHRYGMSQEEAARLYRESRQNARETVDQNLSDRFPRS